jgi:hypothetical protein
MMKQSWYSEINLSDLWSIFGTVLSSWGWFHQHFTWILYAHRFQKRKTDWWLDSIFALLGSVRVKSMHKMLVKSTPDWLLLIHCSVQSQNTREKCRNIEHNLCQCFSIWVPPIPCWVPWKCYKQYFVECLGSAKW